MTIEQGKKSPWYGLKNMRISLTSLFVLFAMICSLSGSSYTNEDEKVIFFPTYAVFKAEGLISIPIHAWVFEFDEDSASRHVLEKILFSLMDVSSEMNNTARFKQRICPFLYDNERGKIVLIEVCGKIYSLNETRANGQSITEIVLSQTEVIKYKNKGYIPFQIIPLSEKQQRIGGKIFVIPSKGLSVISDIDDTLKISDVLDHKELLENTFLHEFKVVAGMPALYQSLRARGAVFHYVSGSPWQLYETLGEFFQKNAIPEGSFHLKQFRLKDSSAARLILTDQVTYKSNIIKKINEDFPLRKFILIGDNGESDPEVFIAMKQQFPDRIIAILIRDVRNGLDNPHRYDKLQLQYKDYYFRLFKKPVELKDLGQFLDDLEGRDQVK